MSEFDNDLRATGLRGLDSETKNWIHVVWSHQQATIDDLKTQLNNMEVCYIQVKKEVEELQARANKALSVTGNYCDEGDAALLIFVLEKALRGES